MTGIITRLLAIISTFLVVATASGGSGGQPSSRPFECGPLQKIMFKTQWAQAFGEADDREEFGRGVWKRMFAQHPEWRQVYFFRVRGDNLRSAEFKAHMARINSAFDMAVNFIMDDEVFEAHMHHLGHQHMEMHIPVDAFDDFRHAIVEEADERIGHCFDFDAWDLCTAYITSGIQMNMAHDDHGHHWGYTHHDGPHTWRHIAPAGRGERQSPIDIHPDWAMYDSALSEHPLQWSYSGVKSKDVGNNGHTVVMSYDGPSSLSGGPLESTYQIAQFHLHWGQNDNSGSEHRVDGKMFPAELHMVHWNSEKYGSLGEAVDKGDGLSVLGVFLEVGATAHPGLTKMIDMVKQVNHKGEKIAASATLLPTELMPADTKSYWTYLGSLTTPPLYESVTWIVFQQPITVSEDQLTALRELYTNAADEAEADDEFHGHMVENYRPPQLLYGRTVRSSAAH